MEGARALAQSELSAIVTLNLWGNCIGKGGAYSISKANWENLTNLNLCTFYTIKTTTKSAIKELSILARQIGKILTISTSARMKSRSMEPDSFLKENGPN